MNSGIRPNDQVFRQHLREVIGGIDDVAGGDLVTETDAALADALGHDLLRPRRRTGHDEQHVGGVDLDELLMRVLAAALRWYRRLRSLRGSSAAPAAPSPDITGDRRILALAGDLVDLIDVIIPVSARLTS